MTEETESEIVSRTATETETVSETESRIATETEVETTTGGDLTACSEIIAPQGSVVSEVGRQTEKSEVGEVGSVDVKDSSVVLS